MLRPRLTNTIAPLSITDYSTLEAKDIIVKVLPRFLQESDSMVNKGTWVPISRSTKAMLKSIIKKDFFGAKDAQDLAARETHSIICHNHC